MGKETKKLDFIFITLGIIFGVLPIVYSLILSAYHQITRTNWDFEFLFNQQHQENNYIVFGGICLFVLFIIYCIIQIYINFDPPFKFPRIFKYFSKKGKGHSYGLTSYTYFDGNLYIGNDGVIPLDMGINSFKAWMPRTTNPYDETTHPHHFHAWNQGWDDTHEENKKQFANKK